MNQNNVLVLTRDLDIIGFIHYEFALRLIRTRKAFTFILKKNLIPKAIKFTKATMYLSRAKIGWSKLNIHLRDDFTCQYCGKKLNKSSATVDHILPKSRGGKNEWKNTVCSCKKCNKLKDNKLLENTKMKLIKKPKKPTIYDFIKK